MSRLARKDWNGLLTIFATFLVVPLGLFLTRPRPISAESVPEMTRQVREWREAEILDQMHQRYEAVGLNFESPDPGNEPQVRWQQLQANLEQNGVDPMDASQIIRNAQSSFGGEWPCLVEKGLLRSHPVWIITGSAPHDTGFLGWACSPSPEDVRHEEIKKYCTDVRVVAIDTAAPYNPMH